MRNQPLRCKENKIKPKTLDQKDQRKDKDKGKTARTRKFTKATYINWAWTAPCWLCFWDWKYEYTRYRASSGDHRLAIKGQLHKQETHYNCSTQTEAFDYLYWSVRLFSLLGTVYTLMPMLKQRSLSAYNQLLTSKPFDQSYFREDNRNMSFCKLLEASFYHVSPFIECSTMSHFIIHEMTWFSWN